MRATITLADGKQRELAYKLKTMEGVDDYLRKRRDNPELASIAASPATFFSIDIAKELPEVILRGLVEPGDFTAERIADEIYGPIVEDIWLDVYCALYGESKKDLLVKGAKKLGRPIGSQASTEMLATLGSTGLASQSQDSD